MVTLCGFLCAYLPSQTFSDRVWAIVGLQGACTVRNPLPSKPIKLSASYSEVIDAFFLGSFHSSRFTICTSSVVYSSGSLRGSRDSEDSLIRFIGTTLEGPCFSEALSIVLRAQETKPSTCENLTSPKYFVL